MLLFIKKLIKILRGGAGGREIMLGLTLGFIIGMTPGFNLVLLALLFAVLVLNANFALVMLGVLFGKLACFGLQPVTFSIGFNLIHGMGLEGLVQSFSKTPVLAWIGIDKYCLVGGLPLGIVGGLIIGALFTASITKIRKTLVKAKNDSEKFQALMKKWYAKLFVRVFAGKTKADMEETLGKESPLFRKGGIILAVAGLVILLVAEFAIFKFGARVGLEKALTFANGAEVNLDSADVSVFGGKVDLKGLQMTDTDAPEKNAFQAERLTADVSVKEFLRKRLVVELIAVDGLEMDVPRKSPGKVLEDDEARKAREERERKEREKAEKEMTPEQMVDKIASIIENWETYERYLSKAKGVVERGLAARRAKKAIMKAGGPKGKLKYLKEKAKREGYLSLSALEWSDEAAFEIKRVQSGGHKVADILPEQSFVLTNVSSAPELVEAPMTAAMEGPDGKETLGVSIAIDDELDARYDVRAAIPDVKLEEAGLSGQVGELVAGGLASATAQGALQGGAFDLPFGLNVKNLKVDPKPGEKVLGMDGATAKQVFAALDSIDLEGRIGGTLSSPTASVDLDKLQKSLGEALKKAGKEMLANKVNEELDKAKQKAKAEADEAITKEMNKVKDEIRAKYGDEIADKIGPENYKKAEAMLDNVDSGTVMKGAAALKGLLGGGQKDDGTETKDGDKTDGKTTGDKVADGAGKLLGGLLKDDEEKKKEDENKDKDDEEKKKKKKSLLDLLN